MPTVIATVGASNANSFVTVAEGDTYCDARLNASAWTDAEDDDKAKAVIEATRELSAKMWVGSKSTTAQALAWPRAYATDPDAAWAGWGYGHAPAHTPAEVWRLALPHELLRRLAMPADADH